MADKNYRIYFGYESAVPCSNYVLGADEPEIAAEQPSVTEMVAQVLELQREEKRARKWALIIGGIGAVFAAARLGIIAIPIIKAKRTRRR